MRYFFLFAGLCSVLILNGCSPTFNWRDVRPDKAPLVALFPCKPDQGTRVVSLGAKDVTMTMLGCDAGGSTFTLAFIDTQDAASTGTVLDQWRSATLSKLRAQSTSKLPFLIKGASAVPPSVQVAARGTRPDGAVVVVHAVWFASGAQLFQAAVYAEAANPAVTESYFSGLRLD